MVWELFSVAVIERLVKKSWALGQNMVVVAAVFCSSGRPL